MRVPPRGPVPRRRRDAQRGARGAARAAAALALIGCGGGGAPAEDFWQDLTKKGGCGDVYFFAHDDEDTILLEIASAGPQIQGDAERTVTWTLPVDAIEITVKTGEGVSKLACDDVAADGGPRVDETWTAVEGTATLVLTPDAVLNWTGSIALEEVHLEADTEQPLDIPRFTIADQSMGDLPG